jgi:hypothetical protein
MTRLTNPVRGYAVRKPGDHKGRPTAGTGELHSDVHAEPCTQ